MAVDAAVPVDPEAPPVGEVINGVVAIIPTNTRFTKIDYLPVRGLNGIYYF